MASTITGNVGGSLFSAAQVQCVDIRTGSITFAPVDVSGNYSFANLAASIYRVSAKILNFVYYHPVQVVADGVTTYANINLNPTALSDSNIPAETGNY
jgi:hypothetical protein